MNISFRGLGLDASDVRSLVDFWCNAYGYHVDRADYPYWAVLKGDAESELPNVIVVRVPEKKSAKNRVHAEFNVKDLKAESERLMSLGATLVAERQFSDARWIVMQDPEGNEFCLLLDHE